MTYATDFDLIFDDTNTLHKIIARAIDKAARNVINESPATANHVERIHWATRIRLKADNLKVESRRWITQVLDNATITTAGNAATDNDVQFVVDGLVDTMAGV